MDKLNILCFGDSLTAGYSGYGMQFTPYGDILEDLLKLSWPDAKLTVSEDGQPGDLVSSPGRFMQRLEKRLSQTPEPYDFIIILGGTNDLGYGRSAEVLSEGLDNIYRTVHAHGANILALTIPECHAVSKTLDAKRSAVNQHILESPSKRFFLPYHSLTKEEREEAWDDGLHFTPRGYEMIGEQVASRLVEIVAEIGVEAAKNSSSKI